MSKDWPFPVIQGHDFKPIRLYVSAKLGTNVHHQTRNVGISFSRDRLSFSAALFSFERIVLMLLKALFERVVNSCESSL